jgi:hypothetical protein
MTVGAAAMTGGGAAGVTVVGAAMTEAAGHDAGQASAGTAVARMNTPSSWSWRASLRSK